MNIDLIFKIALLIVVIGISVKIIKAISSILFKLAVAACIVLLLYSMFYGM